jgi:hypothetical protein
LDDVAFGEVARTWRGLPLQSALKSEGELAVVGGRDLARWRVRGSSGRAATKDVDGALEAFRPPKLVFQNIIAHVARPRPHILLIGAYDAAGSITLDTVNNLSPREAGFPLRGLLALLHSRLVNWFVYSVIYNKAIRTMHFDQYFLDKIPLPAGHEGLLTQLAELAQAAEQTQREIAAAEGLLAADVREATGEVLPPKTLARMLAGGVPRCPELSEPHRQRAGALFARREALAAAIDRAVEQAYGVPGLTEEVI